MLIGLNGFKGVGKSTVGQCLAHFYGFEQLAFADKLKEAVAVLFDTTPEWINSYKSNNEVTVELAHCDKITLRVFLQRFGTEVGRELFGHNFWLDQLLPHDFIIKGDYVVTDARFENELERIQELGGYNIRIVRPGFEGEDHASEVEPPVGLINYTIINDESIFELQDKLRDALRYLHVRNTM